MALNSSVTPITVDPNFSIPPNVVDLNYRNIDDPADSTTSRSADTGEVVNVTYDEVDYGEMGGDYYTYGGDTGSTDLLYPPDSVTVVSQTVRISADGRAVVDVVLEIDDTISGVTYDVRLTKP